MGSWRSDMLEMFKSDFGGPIERKVSGLEDYHVAFEVRLRCDERLAVGDVGHVDYRFRWPYRKEFLRSGRLPRRKS